MPQNFALSSALDVFSKNYVQDLRQRQARQYEAGFYEKQRQDAETDWAKRFKQQRVARQEDAAQQIADQLALAKQNQEYNKPIQDASVKLMGLQGKGIAPYDYSSPLAIAQANLANTQGAGIAPYDYESGLDQARRLYAERQTAVIPNLGYVSPQDSSTIALQNAQSAGIAPYDYVPETTPVDSARIKMLEAQAAGIPPVGYVSPQDSSAIALQNAQSAGIAPYNYTPPISPIDSMRIQHMAAQTDAIRNHPSATDEQKMTIERMNIEHSNTLQEISLRATLSNMGNDPQLESLKQIYTLQMQGMQYSEALTTKRQIYERLNATDLLEQESPHFNVKFQEDLLNDIVKFGADKVAEDLVRNFPEYYPNMQLAKEAVKFVSQYDRRSSSEKAYDWFNNTFRF